MAYCRFSSDDWLSDVYTYETEYGFVTHVAATRYVGVENVPAAYGERVEWLERAEAVEIGLPHDGKTFCDNTPDECAQRLLWLRADGYHVPQDAVDRLQAEAGYWEPEVAVKPGIVCDCCGEPVLVGVHERLLGVCGDCVAENKDVDHPEPPPVTDGP